MVNGMSLLAQVPAHTTVVSRVTANIIICSSHSLPSLHYLELIIVLGKLGQRCFQQGQPQTLLDQPSLGTLKPCGDSGLQERLSVSLK